MRKMVIRYRAVAVPDLFASANVMKKLQGFETELGVLSRMRVALKTDTKLDKELVAVAVRPLDELIQLVGRIHTFLVPPSHEVALKTLKKKAGGLVRKRDNGFEADIGQLSRLRTTLLVDQNLTREGSTCRETARLAVQQIDALTDALISLNEFVQQRKAAAARTTSSSNIVRRAV
jgi:hypothetical protein